MASGEASNRSRISVLNCVCACVPHETPEADEEDDDEEEREDEPEQHASSASVLFTCPVADAFAAVDPAIRPS